MFSIDSEEYRIFKKLDTAEKIQSYLEALPMNHEKKGETCMSPRRVLREKKAHCFEGALFACVCLMLQGEKPEIVNLKVKKTDVDHIIVPFNQNGYLGAISKTNHGVLRYRDPVYKNLRELVMSYFHEYFLTKNGDKTLLGYSRPINMRRFGTEWMIREDNLWDISEVVYDSPIMKIVPEKNVSYLRKATAFEQKVASIPEWNVQ